ncbi:unnamed protein product [Lactuca saligna]|uniref:Uncharacterized protein n=1 Tax=Lactuca saligna TaxID=75948 RepID=A0AA35VIQ7_LACSI|nr:unnamed protein product [Lactuca saligna]
MTELCNSLRTNCLAPFLDVVGWAIESTYLKITVAIFYFWTVAASAIMGFYQAPILVENEVIPLKAMVGGNSGGGVVVTVMAVVVTVAGNDGSAGDGSSWWLVLAAIVLAGGSGSDFRWW